MKAKQKLYRILCILLTCMMVLNAPMSVLAFEDVQIVDVVEEAEIVADEEFSSDEVTFTDEEIVSEEILFSEEISEESTEEPEEQVLDNSLEDAVEPGLFEDESSELGEGIEEVMSVDTMELFSEGIERLTSSTIPEGMNIERITEVTQIAKGDEITFSMWGMEYSAPSYVATVPAGTETVTVTFKGGTHPDPYGNPAKLSGCMVTYNADEGSGSAGGTESDVVQGEDGLYSINLDVASMIEDSKYYGAYDSSYKTLYLLGFTYAEDETHEHSYENGSCTVCGEADPDYVAPDGITIPEGMNIERITEVTQITAGDEITFSMWGTESSAPSYVATVPAGTETVTVTFKSGTHPTPYGSPAKLSGCMVTYNADEGSVSAGGTESDAVQGEDGLYSINLDVASMIEDSKYYGAYDSSYKMLYLLGFAYAEDEGGSSEEPDEPNAPFLSISIGENELDKDSILYKCLYKLGSWESSYSYVHEVPYYHVIVPMGTTHVDVTYGADADIFDDGSTVYGYSTTLDGVDAVSSATVRSTTLRDSYTLNDDGTQTIKIPVTDYQFNDKCEGKAITAEGEGEGYPALTLFTFEYKDHTHKYADETTDPTCTTGGYTVYTCTCGHRYKGDEVSASGHDWGEWERTAEPNCTDSGSETRTCVTCGETETQSVAALGHSWSDSDWDVTREATCTEDGEETRACSRCEAKESKTIAATGHNYVDKICSVCGAVDASPEQVNGVYQISNADELMWFAQTVNSGNGTISAVLTADIDLTGKEWIAIGDFNKPFAGSFDGQNHKVTFDNTYGLFYRVRGASNSARAEIKNVIIEGTAQGAGVAYYVQFANFENCINRAAVSAGVESCAAGIVGDSPMILWNDIAGHVKIINCVNAGTITGSAGSTSYTGGIFGYAVGDMVVADCSNTGNINGGQNVGGIGGYFQGSKASYITNAYNTGKVTGTGVVGGIVGSVHNGTTIANCYNAGEAKYGVTGQIYNHTATIKNTYWLVAASAQGVPASYSSNSNAIGDNISAVSKTRAEMVSEEFAALLGGSFKASCPAAVLTWQTANAHDMMEIPGVGTVCVRCGLGTKSTFDVTKSIDDSYTISGDDEAVEGEDYTFTVEITEGYEKSPNFTVTVGTEVMEEKEGVYTVENVAGPLSIIVTGVVKIPTSHTITLPATGNGYAVVSEEGYTTTVDRNGDYKFTVEFADGFRAGKNLKVMANDEKLSADDNGVYTISNIVADQKIEISGTEMIPYDDTVNVSFTITKGIDEFYVGKSGDILAQEVIEVPYFDLELYDLERYYYNPYCYVDKDGKPVNQTAGTKETAYGVITAMHAYICATEIYYLGMDPDDVGQGFADENAKNDFNEAISWTQGAGSSFMNLWGDGTNLNYYVNYVYPLGREEWGATSDQIALKDGDIISIHFIEGNASGSNYGFFVADDDNRSYDTTDTIETKTVVQGDKITLTLYNAGAAGNYLTGYSRMKEQKLFWTEELTADIYKWNYHKAAVDLEEGEANTGFANLTSDQMVTDENGNITIDTTNLNPGTYYIASKGGVSAGGMVDSDGFTSRGNESGPALFVLIVEGSGQKTEDEQQAATVVETITALPAADQLTVADTEAVEKAREAYEALTEEQKVLVSEEVLKLLIDAETKIAELKKAEEEQQKEEEEAAANKAAAEIASNTITALPSADKLTAADAEAVEAARTAYEALTDAQKALVSAETLKQLEAAEAKIAELTHVHSWDAGTVTKAATCKETGVKTFKCSCGETKTETIATTTSHQYGAWTVESEATVKAAEVQKHICSVCGKEETKDVGKALTPVLEIPGKLSSFNMKKDKTAKFEVTMANGDSVSSVKSSKTKILKATLDKKTGKITVKGVKKGTSKLTIKLASGKSRTYTVKVVTGTVKTSGLSVTNVTDKKLTLTVKKSHTLKSEVKPFTSTQKVTYKSSNKKIAKVTSGGKITAVAPGKATITATSGSKKVKITVTVPGIENVKSSVSVKKNKTLTLKPKTYGISEKVTYTSSNTKVATVTANGKIKGIKKGTAKITIKAGTFTKTVKVTVK